MVNNISKMEKIGINIQNERKRNQMSQKDLAAELNLTSSSVSNWEKGKSLPDIGNLIELCKIFNVSSDELLGIKPVEYKNRPTSSNISTHPETELEEDLIENFRKLNKENKYRSITNVIDLLESQTEVNKETVKKEGRMGA